MKLPLSLLIIPLIFFSLIGAVLVLAYARKSGNTGIDITLISQLRQKE